MPLGEYRIIEKQPHKFFAQIKTVTGWLDMTVATSLEDAVEFLGDKRISDNWKPKIYDEHGRLASDQSSTD